MTTTHHKLDKPLPRRCLAFFKRIFDDLGVVPIVPPVELEFALDELDITLDEVDEDLRFGRD